MEKVYDLVVSGKIVLEHEVIAGEIGVSEGKITSIQLGDNCLNGLEKVDFGDSFIFPGFIDTHVHCFSNPNEGFITTSQSAAVGGITTLLDMPYDLPNPIINPQLFVEKRERLEKEAIVDIGLWATISKTGGTDMIRPLAEAGATAFKMSTFETDPFRFPRIPDSEILKAFEIIRGTGLRAAFHSENDNIIFDKIHEYKAKGKVYPRAHMETRPPVSETSAVLKLLEFAYWTGVQLHIVHVSHPRTIELINIFKSQGVQVTCETCYPYLLLNVNDLDKYGPKAKMNPPLREPQDVELLWEQLRNSNIEMITSDHAPWNTEQKDVGKDNIFLAASGLPGVEILVPLMFSNTVATGKLSPEKFARLLSTNPAEVFHINRKGKIAIGYDADFTVINPNEKTSIDESMFKSKSKLSPFHGTEITGKIVQTIVRGVTVFDGISIVVEPGFGTFVPGSSAKSRV